MYKVLLVDDELLDLNVMQNYIDWARFGMEVAASASNGFSAWEHLTKLDIDILVSDINLPIMTGLELARKALEHKPKLRVVFVSGYSEFHYAKQAITLNASGYVLKPIDDDELHAVLRQIREGLDTERSRADWEKNEAISRLLNGREVVIDLRSTRGIAVAVIEIDNVIRKEGVSTSEEDVRNRIHLLLAAVLERRGVQYFAKSEPNRVVTILQDESPSQTMQDVIRDVGGHASGGSITVGLGKTVSEAGELADSYQDAKEALSYKMFLGNGRLIRTSAIRKDTAQQAKKLDDVLDAMYPELIHYGLVQIDDRIDELCLLLKGLADKHAVYAYVLQVMSKLDVRLHALSEDLYQILDIDDRKLEFLFRLETIEDVRWWLRRKLFQLSEVLQMKRRTKNRKLIGDIEQYIIQHIEQDFTLKDVAMRFSFSPNYLGHLFKEETGSNFSDFVLARKMEHASKLLQVSSTKVYEVASRLGYKKVSSFNRQFKEQFGLTPSEYRKQG